MRIAVTDLGRAFGRQTRAYAEYRVFSSLVRFGDVVHEADVSLAPLALDGSTARCSVDVRLKDGHHLRASAKGRHAYDAINRAALRIREGVRRHIEVSLSPVTLQEP
jgi:ribosome-associated translation inhibitor RaiA